MNQNRTLLVLSSLAALALSLGTARAQIIITEVDPYGSSSNTGYAGDWFELTNYGSTAQSISGWQVIDSHTEGGSTAEVPLLGVTSIAAGQSVVFLDYSSQPGGTLALQEASEQTAFDEAWYGTPTAPVGDVFGYYNGTNIGLSQSGDEVNILNGSGVQQAGVAFGNDSTASPLPTFDNSAKLNSTSQSSDATLAELTTFSVVGTDDAFVSASGKEIGSPDEVTNAPEPGTWALLGLSGMAFLAWRRRGALLGL